VNHNLLEGAIRFQGRGRKSVILSTFVHGPFSIPALHVAYLAAALRQILHCKGTFWETQYAIEEGWLDPSILNNPCQGHQQAQLRHCLPSHVGDLIKIQTASFGVIFIEDLSPLAGEVGNVKLSPAPGC